LTSWPRRSTRNTGTLPRTILFKDGQIELHLTAQARNESETVKLLDDLAGRLDEVLGEYVFSRNNETLEEVAGQLLKLRGYTLATAESCTGGLLAGRITEVPGSSEYFLEASSVIRMKRRSICCVCRRN